MSRNEPKQKIKPQVFLRLLQFTKPYWLRLSIGILAGMLVGGSLFVTLLLIPGLVGVVDSGGAFASESKERLLAERIVRTIGSDPKASNEIKIEAVTRELAPQDDDPQLTKVLKQAESAARNFRLPYRVEGRSIHLLWPVDYTFDVVGASGRIAWQIFAIYTILFVVFWALKNVAHYVNGYCTRYVGARAVADMRAAIFRRLMDQSLNFYGKVDVGHMISRCTNDTSALESAVSHSVEDLTNAPLQVLGCLAAILVACRQYQNFSLVFILLIGFPIIVLPINIIGRKIRKLYKKAYARIADVFSRMHESFSCIRVVKAYHAENQETVRFDAANNRYFRQVVRALRYHLMISPAMELVAVSCVLVFLLYTYAQGVTITELAALLSPAFMAYRPIKDIAKVVATLQQSMGAADRFFELIDTHDELPEKPDAVELKAFNRAIELEHVSFKYDDKIIIDDLSLTIPHGSMVAVVGETGSGKTTVANLIARFYDVSSGAVRIDGVDVRDCSIASLRGLIGVVNQDAILFDDTIAYNIAYGKPDATREEIVEAAKLANAHEFIVDGRHPAGYDTEVGEKGFLLSGGEKQRLAIARAILRNPPILILDEATSALDTVTEKLVQDALNRAMSNRTVFAIAHRLSTIQKADLILVLEHGHIAEAGSHAELMAKNGMYRRLHNTQFEMDEVHS
ncbi:MAG: ABC transporter ATP-binding protein [Victivallaceae bacterium]|nr:ABC transporter ATP-binding protein [Victivallaceae bacterium]